MIDSEHFIIADLEKQIDCTSILVEGTYKFDLVISLEVAEHLSIERERSFVKDLTLLSDVILFSAAIPGQGGEGHINERYLSEWCLLFGEIGYEAYDIVRPRIWNDASIPWWYRQNIMLFINRESEKKNRFDKMNANTCVDVICKEIYEQKRRKCEWYDNLGKSKKNRVMKVIRGIGRNKN